MKVLISDPVAPEAVKELEEAGFVVDVKTGMSEEDLIGIIPGYSAIVVRSATKVTGKIIEAGKDLKVIARGGIGLDNIDREAARLNNVMVVNTPGASSLSVAELAFGQMLAVSRKLAEADASMKNGRWEKKKLKGVEITGKTMGILGIGNIGRYIARMGGAFGMRILAFDPYVDKERGEELGVEITDFGTLLKAADYITLHLPLTDSTRHMISDKEFSSMKDGVIIVNCARGGIIDEPALVRAVQSGKVRGAAFDVFEEEPINQDCALLGVPGIYLTPHIGASTVEGQFRVGMEVARKLKENLL